MALSRIIQEEVDPPAILSAEPDVPAVSPTAPQEDLDLSSTEENGLILSLQAKRDTWNMHLYGNHNACCFGKIKIRRVTATWWMLKLLILGSLIALLAENTKFHLMATGVAIILGFTLVLSLSWITVIDPGVIRKPEFEIALLNAHKYVRTICMPANQHSMRIIQNSYCSSCHHFRTPKSKHCPTCDCCIEHRDHHCPTIGTCIGKNNLLAFKIMIVTLVLYYLFILISSLCVAVTSYVNNGGEPLLYMLVSASYTLSTMVMGSILLGLYFCMCENW